MAKRKASDVFVECLEAEGVKHVFGIPGEETLDLNESLEDSSVEFLPVRHEQGGAYMADVCGRLTGRAGDSRVLWRDSDLSLIHILRCRRGSGCRELWSPGQ